MAEITSISVADLLALAYDHIYSDDCAEIEILAAGVIALAGEKVAQGIVPIISQEERIELFRQWKGSKV